MSSIVRKDEKSNVSESHEHHKSYHIDADKVTSVKRSETKVYSTGTALNGVASSVSVTHKTSEKHVVIQKIETHGENQKCLLEEHAHDGRSVNQAEHGGFRSIISKYLFYIENQVPYAHELKIKAIEILTPVQCFLLEKSKNIVPQLTTYIDYAKEKVPLYHKIKSSDKDQFIHLASEEIKMAARSSVQAGISVKEKVSDWSGKALKIVKVNFEHVKSKYHSTVSAAHELKNTCIDFVYGPLVKSVDYVKENVGAFKALTVAAQDKAISLKHAVIEKSAPVFSYATDDYRVTKVESVAVNAASATLQYGIAVANYGLNIFGLKEKVAEHVLNLDAGTKAYVTSSAPLVSVHEHLAKLGPYRLVVRAVSDVNGQVRATL